MLGKLSDITTNINVATTENGFIGANFYTEDDGNAYIRITIKDNNQVLDFNKTDMLPRLDLFCSDGSIFTNEPLDILLPDKGVIQYKVSDNVITHAGRIDAKLFLANDKDSIHVANFYFTITDSGMTGPIGKEISVELLEKYVANVMSKNAMGLLSDEYRERLETEIKKYIIDNNKSFNLKFEDLTRSEKDELMKNLTNEGLADFRIEDNTITTSKIADRAITPEKTSFIDKSNNLLNKNDVIANKNLDRENGELINSGTNSVFITWFPVREGEIYTSKEINTTVFYDNNKKFISVILGSGTFTVPANATYMRISTPKLNEAQLNRGDKLFVYDEYIQPTLSSEIKINNLPDNIVTTPHIKDKAVTPEKLSFVSESENLIDKSKMTKNYGVLVNSNGEIVPNNTASVTDFINVEPNTIYTASTGAHRIALYDKNKKYIGQDYSSNTGFYTFTTPENAQYLRINVYATRREDPILNKGDKLLPYSDWHEPILEGITIKNLPHNTNSNSNKPSKTFVIDDTLNLNYTPQNIQGCSDNDPLPMSQIKYTDFYSFYDELCNKYPTYVTRIDEGENEDGKKIYSYKFKPEEPEYTINSKPTEKPFKKMKFFISSSTHGNERTSIWTLYNMMKEICDNWKTDEALEFLRWNVEFIIIPILNPSGYEKFTRINGRGVDINRNFDADWENGSDDTTQTTYRGPKAMSEPATIICDNILKRESPDYVIDFHNFHTQEKPNYFNWLIGYTDKSNEIGDIVLTKLARKWKQLYPDIDQNVPAFGYTSPAILAGTLPNYAHKKYGIPSTSYEVCWKLDAKPGVINRDSFISTIGVDSIVNYVLQLAKNINEL